MESTSDQQLHREAIRGAGGFKLSVWEHRTAEPLAMLCIVHGHGEHSGRYLDMARALASDRILVMGYDHRGHGLSGGIKGGPAGAKKLLEDLGYFLMYARAQHNDLPLFLFGHSMGGNLAANYLIADKSREIAGAIISSAWFRLAMPLHPHVKALGRWAGTYLPFFRVFTRIKAEQLTRDPVRAEEIDQDPLARHTIAAGLYQDLTLMGERAIRESGLIDVPMLVTHGTDDGVTALEASRQFAENAGQNARFKAWKGQLHEPHQDEVKDAAYALYADWMREMLNAGA